MKDANKYLIELSPFAEKWLIRLVEKCEMNPIHYFGINNWRELKHKIKNKPDFIINKLKKLTQEGKLKVFDEIKKFLKLG